MYCREPYQPREGRGPCRGHRSCVPAGETGTERSNGLPEATQQCGPVCVPVTTTPHGLPARIPSRPLWWAGSPAAAAGGGTPGQRPRPSGVPPGPRALPRPCRPSASAAGPAARRGGPGPTRPGVCPVSPGDPGPAGSQVLSPRAGCGPAGPGRGGGSGTAASRVTRLSPSASRAPTLRQELAAWAPDGLAVGELLPRRPPSSPQPETDRGVCRRWALRPGPRTAEREGQEAHPPVQQGRGTGEGGGPGWESRGRAEPAAEGVTEAAGGTVT